MITYKPVETSGHKKLSNIPSKYYYCLWNESNKLADSLTKEDEALEPPTYPNFPNSKDGIGVLESEGFDAFLQAVYDEGVTIPDELLNNEPSQNL